MKLVVGNYLISTKIHNYCYTNFLYSESAIKHTSVITFHQKDFKHLNWLEDNEFLLTGIKYDIVKTEKISSDSIKVFCVADNLETFIENSLEENFEKDHDKSSQKSLKKITSDEYFIWDWEKIILISFWSPQHYTIYKTSFTQFFSECSQIPPERV